jgi:maltose-binding protein MalE
LFETGKIPFLMAGPWALDRIRASGVPYAVANFFPDNGVPFLGVQGFMVNAFSENVLLAQAFLTEFVATEEFMQRIYETGLRPSAFKSVLETTDDLDLKAMGEAGAEAMPMPNIPEMGSVWTAADNGIALR